MYIALTNIGHKTFLYQTVRVGCTQLALWVIHAQYISQLGYIDPTSVNNSEGSQITYKTTVLSTVR
jgi:hypothetical protein